MHPSQSAPCREEGAAADLSQYTFMKTREEMAPNKIDRQLEGDLTENATHLLALRDPSGEKLQAWAWWSC